VIDSNEFEWAQEVDAAMLDARRGEELPYARMDMRMLILSKNDQKRCYGNVLPQYDQRLRFLNLRTVIRRRSMSWE